MGGWYSLVFGLICSLPQRRRIILRSGENDHMFELLYLDAEAIWTLAVTSFRFLTSCFALNLREGVCDVRFPCFFVIFRAFVGNLQGTPGTPGIWPYTAVHRRYEAVQWTVTPPAAGSHQPWSLDLSRGTVETARVKKQTCIQLQSIAYRS